MFDTDNRKLFQCNLYCSVGRPFSFSQNDQKNSFKTELSNENLQMLCMQYLLRPSFCVCRPKMAPHRQLVIGLVLLMLQANTDSGAENRECTTV